MERISLSVCGEKMIAKRSTLCEYSDYFRAMFSGNYKETHQDTIEIDLIDASTMSTLLRYMDLGLIDLSEYSINDIGDLALAANFLQMAELIKQIKYTLELMLSTSNWIEILTLSRNLCYTDLEKIVVRFGLLSFQYIEPDCIQTSEQLVWYLSHPNLYVDCEWKVFYFSHKWHRLHKMPECYSILVTLGCLDIKMLTREDLKQIKSFISDYQDPLSSKLIECMDLLIKSFPISSEAVLENKNLICEKFNIEIYEEILDLVKECTHRTLPIKVAVPCTRKVDGKKEPPCLYTIGESCNKYKEIAESSLWGFSVTSWGLDRIVVTCGEFGKGRSLFLRDVRVYDVMTNIWTHHGVQLPGIRHAGVIVKKDTLYIAGGVSRYRVISNNVIAYDLKCRSHRSLSSLIKPIQSPGMCVHDNNLYLADYTCISKLSESESGDKWINILDTMFRIQSMVSYKGRIYGTQVGYTSLYSFQPDVEHSLTLVTNFQYPAHVICNAGNLLAFTIELAIYNQHFFIERFIEKDNSTCVTYKSEDGLEILDIAGFCTFVDETLPIEPNCGTYSRRLLSKGFTKC